MASKTAIFLTGATGYIGGSVLAGLLAHPNASTFDIIVLVRSPEKAEKLKAFGVNPIVGSLKDTTLLEDLTSKAHVVFACADADDRAATEATLRGLKKRHAATGVQPILIYTSGTGVLTYKASTEGMSVTDKIWDDSNADDIEKSLPEDAGFHRDIDLLTVKADQEGYVRSYMVIPSTIWGIAKSPLVDAGIVNSQSLQIPALIKTALARGQAGMVGKGVARWPNVNIQEIADLYINLFDALTKNPEKVGHGRDGYYFGITEEHSWYDLSKEIGKVLFELGITKAAEPTTFAREELPKYFGSEQVGLFFGTNSRGVANHSKSIGWNPKKGTQAMLASIKPEVEAILKQQK